MSSRFQRLPSPTISQRLCASAFKLLDVGLARLATLATLTACLATTAAMAAEGAAAEPRRPNVLVILSDDQGLGDLSVHGNTNLSTPNVDSLARDGAMFDRFYVCPVCSPTRAEFLTGRYHVRGGVYSTSTGGERLDLDEKTIGDTFKAAGYATGAFGKWHNGAQYPYHPNARGFDEYYGFCSGHWGDYFNPPLEHNGKLVRGNGFIIDDLADKAMDFIEANREQPFFCYVPMNTPHSPMQVPDRFYEKFASAELPLRHQGVIEPSAPAGKQKRAAKRDEAPTRAKNAKRAGASTRDEEDLTFTRAALAMCENIDWNVGRLLAKLDELDLADDTIVLYFCDNGPNSYRWNGGMRGRKGSTDEGGVRSPLLIRWPGHIAPATKVAPIAAAIDLLPTLADMAGIPVASQKPLDGRSLSPLLVEDAAEWSPRMIFSHWSGQVSVRNQRYRLDSQGRLYDMQRDGGQTRDIAGEQPQVAERLTNAADRWRQTTLAELVRDDGRPFPVGYHEFPITWLPARDGVAHGNIERSAGAPNCSYYTNWVSTDDAITWDIEVATAGEYEAVVYYTCTNENVGSTLELALGAARASNQVTEAHDPPLVGAEHDRASRGSESYVKDFKPLTLGMLELTRGRGQLTLRATDIPGKAAIDMRTVVLTLKE